MKILSIDWDYLIDASADYRASNFPDGGSETIPPYLMNFIWMQKYNKDLNQIGIKNKEYNDLKEILKQDFLEIMIADSHKHIYEFIENNLDYEYEEEIDIVNIDFHHDLYGYKEEFRKDVDCGNWAIKMMENYNCNYTWIKQNDSDDILHTDITNNIQRKNFDEIINDDYDLLYICRSGSWSPPHLDKYFIQLCKPLLEQTTIPVKYQTDVMQDRYNEEFIKGIEENNKMLNQLRSKNEEIRF